jgi:glyoxylase-like metal-dependent hydrolase (beta-lactamase superfamily II)
MTQQIPLDFPARADAHTQDHAVHEIAPDIAYRRLAIVNIVLVGAAGSGNRRWVLVDAGLFGTKTFIKSAAAERFGEGARPSAIVLTHGHFDHVGVLEDLADEWDVPVYAHSLERSFLDGTLSYPPPDPGVGGGLVTLSSGLFPRGPVNVGSRLILLPQDGSMPPLPGWRWIATRGHARGHVSLWRERDRAMIVGDALVTTAQESIYAAVMQEPEMHGAPMYFTPDWVSARESVRRLAALDPELVITGHGRPMRGAPMRHALHQLAREFDEVAVPKQAGMSEASAGAHSRKPPPRALEGSFPEPGDMPILFESNLAVFQRTIWIPVALPPPNCVAHHLN